MSWRVNKEWLNGKSYIPQEDIFEPKYIHIINKLSLVLASKDYFEDTKEFCRSVLDFAIEHEFITWKQANAVLRIETTEVRRQKYGDGSGTTMEFIYNKSNFTDKEHDMLHKQLFGGCTYSENMEGYATRYRSDGSRYFTLPTKKETLSDFL